MSLWKRQPGKARNYKNDATGEVISRRQYDKLTPELRGVARKQVSFPRLMQQRRKQAVYNALVRDFGDAQAKAGKPVSPREARQSAELARLIGELRARNKDGTPAKRRIKNALVALGRREGIPYNVAPGDSHKWLKAQERLARRQAA